MDTETVANQLAIALERNMIVTRITLSANALMVFDYFLTLPDEIELVWRSRWNIVKVLFLLNRYTAFWDMGISIYSILGPHLTSSTCSGLYTSHGWLAAVGISTSEIILAFRTYALWRESKRIAYALGLVTVIGLIFVAFTLNKALHSVEFIPVSSISPELRGCFVTRVNTSWYILIWSMALASETIIMILTAIKALQSYRFWYPASPLLYTIFRDGLLAYLPLFTSSLVNVLIATLATPGYTYTLSQTQYALHVVLTSRIVLNIRRRARCEAVASNFEEMELAQTISDFVAGPAR
ncbi:hypothetical protein EVG20_g5392 [Dentipellis fragilis]|uniref:DUF6533 domain-containing protein n=1 Tax=Dentipellis fragilis TaxID=205917 RepID=A0A4Y9YVK1_9AGAM|nr:hypothetical protein EVG20_g5392 [Dentipellis fragilis]